MSRYLAATLVLAAGMLGCQKENARVAYISPCIIVSTENHTIDPFLACMVGFPEDHQWGFATVRLPIPKELETE